LIPIAARRNGRSPSANLQDARVVLADFQVPVVSEIMRMQERARTYWTWPWNLLDPVQRGPPDQYLVNPPVLSVETRMRAPPPIGRSRNRTTGALSSIARFAVSGDLLWMDRD
jgi:hypothetical protein